MVHRWQQLEDAAGVRFRSVAADTQPGSGPGSSASLAALGLGVGLDDHGAWLGGSMELAQSSSSSLGSSTSMGTGAAWRDQADADGALHSTVAATAASSS